MPNNKSYPRKRNCQLIIRLTEKELSDFTEKMKSSKLKNRADFIMALVRNKPIIVFDELTEILTELKREGNNFNQGLKYMKALNASAPSWQMKDAESTLENLYDRLSGVISEIAEVRK